MASTNSIITEHINQGRDRVSYDRRQLLAAAEQDRPAWQMQLQADEAALNKLIQFKWDAITGTDLLALAEQRREELRQVAEAVDGARNHGAHTRGEAGGIAEEAIVMRAIAPFTAVANLHHDLWKAGHTGA